DRNELLHQVTTEEPRSPRRVNKAIPDELEIIVLKAMAKSPDERYATAQDFAADLRRFLEDKPIQARRPSWWQRVKKWRRRHRAVVTATALVMDVALVALALSTWLIWRERDRAEQHAREARQAVDDMYTRLAEKWIAEEPRLEEVQREFLEKALHFYQK